MLSSSTEALLRRHVRFVRNTIGMDSVIFMELSCLGKISASRSLENVHYANQITYRSLVEPGTH